LVLLPFSFCKAQIRSDKDYTVIELGIELITNSSTPELQYDIDLFDDGIIDYKIIFNGREDDPLASQHTFDKIVSYNGNSAGFNSIDSSFCQDTVFREAYYTAISLLPGDSINDSIIFDTIPLSCLEYRYSESIYNGDWCYVHYNYKPSNKLITPLTLSSGEKGYLETKVIYYDAHIILERIVLGTDIVLTGIGIPENINTDYLKVYPNPSTGIVHFNYDRPFNEIQLLAITDIAGKPLKQYHNLNSFPDIEIPKCGYYLIKIQIDNDFIVKKIIVI